MKIRFLLDVLLGHSHIKNPDLIAKEVGKDTFDVSLVDNPYDKNVLTILDVPDYQKLWPQGILGSKRKLRSPLYEGFLIDLEKCKGFEDYLKSRFNAKGARNLRRQEKKLYREIAPQRAIHFGQTKSETLDSIFQALQWFLERRFDEKEEENYELPLLPLYRRMFGELLPARKAVVFSLLDKNCPLALGIGFVDGTTLYLFNVSYDLSYSRYGPGNQIMMDAIKWCFDHGIDRVDMGRGDFLHKRQWVNTSYTYTQINLYDPGNILGGFQCLFSWTKNHCRFYGLRFLKKLQVHKLAKRWFILKHRMKNKNALSGITTKSKP